MSHCRNESSQLTEEEGQLEALQAALPASTGPPLGVTPPSTGEDVRGLADPAGTGVSIRVDSGPPPAPYPEASTPRTTSATAHQDATTWSAGITADTSRSA